jgi:hypothetical protein
MIDGVLGVKVVAGSCWAWKIERDLALQQLRDTHGREDGRNRRPFDDYQWQFSCFQVVGIPAHIAHL